MLQRVEYVSDWYSNDAICKKAEKVIEDYTERGWKLINTTFGINGWWKPTMFLFFEKDELA